MFFFLFKSSTNAINTFSYTLHSIFIQQKPKEDTNTRTKTTASYDEDVSHIMVETKMHLSDRGNVIVPNKDRYEDSDMMCSASSLQNYVNDKMTILEDKYCIGQSCVRDVAVGSSVSSGCSNTLLWLLVQKLQE
jgi:hypothetical protein